MTLHSLSMINATFREKSAWSVLIGLIVVFGYYFYEVLSTSPANFEALRLFIAAVVALVAVEITLHVVAAISDTREAARSGGDERDVLIDLKATRISARVLGAGALLSASLWIFGATTLHMANAVILSLVLAEMARCISQLVLYRRGA